MDVESDPYTDLIEFGRELLHNKSYEGALSDMSIHIKRIIEADRCSIFTYDATNSKLSTTLSDGIEKIVINANTGIAGKVLETKQTVIENDTYSNPAFYSKIDEESGYKTQNILASPIFNANKEVTGVLQLLNKEGGFDENDTKLILFLTDFIGRFQAFIDINSNL